jgi:hypothetical protein
MKAVLPRLEAAPYVQLLLVRVPLDWRRLDLQRGLAAGARVQPTHRAGQILHELLEKRTLIKR